MNVVLLEESFFNEINNTGEATIWYSADFSLKNEKKNFMCLGERQI